MFLFGGVRIDGIRKGLRVLWRRWKAVEFRVRKSVSSFFGKRYSGYGVEVIV